MKRQFRVVIEKDPESKWLVGEVVELPGCYTQAPDLPALEVNIKETIRAYLKTAQPEKAFSDSIVIWGGVGNSLALLSEAKGPEYGL